MLFNQEFFFQLFFIIIKCLLEDIEKLMNKIFNRIMSDNTQMNKMICQSFEKMATKVLTPANTPDECVELLEFINVCRSIECVKLKVNI